MPEGHGKSSAESQSPNEPPLSPLRLEWLPFTQGVRSLLVPQPDDRPLDQYLALRDSALAQVQNEQFLGELDQLWKSKASASEQEVMRALVMELKAFTLAQEVAQSTAKDVQEAKGWQSKFLDRASIAVGSTNDILEDSPWYAKVGVSLFKEVIDIFRGQKTRD
jgi:hypothetical protein